MAKSIEEFRNIRELCTLCEDSIEPSVITKDENGKLIIMSLSDFEDERLYIQKVYNNLKKSTEELNNGAPLTDAFDFLTEMRLSYAGE